MELGIAPMESAVDEKGVSCVCVCVCVCEYGCVHVCMFRSACEF